MSDSVDRILELIDEGLLDAERQRTTEPAMSLDEPPVVTSAALARARAHYESNAASFCGPIDEEYEIRNGAGAVVARHVCVPECGDGAHVAGPVTFSERAMDAYAERLAEQVALDVETVYVRLHTSEPRTPDDAGWTNATMNVTGWVLDLGDGTIVSSGWLGERVADESD